MCSKYSIIYNKAVFLLLRPLYYLLEAGAKMHTAFVFIKPHAVQQWRQLVYSGISRFRVRV